jgi:hypothetical protein
MKSEMYQCLNIYKADYDRFKARKDTRIGLTLAGLFHEMLEKTEPTPRNHDGKFAKTQEDTNANRTANS